MAGSEREPGTYPVGCIRTRSRHRFSWYDFAFAWRESARLWPVFLMPWLGLFMDVMAYGVWCLDEGGYPIDITLCYYNTVRKPTGGLILGVLQKGHLQLSYLLVTGDGWLSLNICAGCEARTWKSMYFKPRNHCDYRFLSLSWGRVEIKAPTLTAKKEAS